MYFLTALVPAFKSIPRVPSEAFYIPVWLFLLATLRPDIFFSKEFLASMSFLVVHLFYLIIANYSKLDARVTETQADLFVSVFFATSIWSYLKVMRATRQMELLFKALIVFVVLTCLTTIYGLYKYPIAARELIGNQDQAQILMYLRMNIGSYSFQYLLVFLGPIMLSFYKATRKQYWLAIYALVTITVIYAQIVAAIMLFAVNSVLTPLLLYKGVTMRRYLTVLAGASILFIFGKPVLSTLFNTLAVYSEYLGFLSVKMKEMSMYFENDGNVDASTAINIYQYGLRYDESVAAFLKSPIIGGNPSGGHHFWIDNLAEHGILGTFPWVIVCWQFLRSARNYFTMSEYILVFNSVIIFITIGVNKNILISSMPVFVFFIVPLLLTMANVLKFENEKVAPYG